MSSRNRYGLTPDHGAWWFEGPDAQGLAIIYACSTRREIGDAPDDYSRVGKPFQLRGQWLVDCSCMPEGHEWGGWSDEVDKCFRLKWQG